MGDYPDWSYRAASVPVPEISAGSYQPWYWSYSVTIGAGASDLQTFAIPNDGYVYCIDSVNVSASADIYGRYALFLNNDVVAWQYFKGFSFIDLTTNPAIAALYGESYKVQVTNHDSSSRTFYVTVVGTKYKKPSTYGKPPIALFDFSPKFGVSPLTVQFTDQSVPIPTSWDWDFGDNTPHSNVQNPSHQYTQNGTYYPKLTAYNQYGYDVYQSPTPINVYPYVNFLDGTWVEVDNANIITRSQYRVTSSGSNSTVGNYVYKDYGANNINGIDIKFVACPGNTNTDMVAVMVTYGSPGCYRRNGSYRVYCEFYRGNVFLEYRETTAALCSGSVPWHGATPYYLRLVRSPNSSTFYLYKYSDSSYTTVVASASINCVPSSRKFRYLVVACDSCTASRICSLYVENVYPVISS